MNGLDSPLEALAFNPVNLGPLLTAVVNHLWTCLAVFTAAFSFWRLKTTAVKPGHVAIDPPPQTTPSLSSSPISSPVPPPTTTSSSVEEDDDGIDDGMLTKGSSSKKFFTVYYKEEEERENDDGDDVDGGDESVVKRWPTKLAVEIGLRGDLGWYGYQDVTVLDGSVVRLWDNKRRRSVGVTPLAFCLDI